MKLKNLTIVGSLLAVGCSGVNLGTKKEPKIEAKKEDVRVDDLQCYCNTLRWKFHAILENVDRNFNGTTGDSCSGAGVDYSKAVMVAKRIKDCCNDKVVHDENVIPEESVQAGMEVIRHVLAKHGCLPEEQTNKKPEGVAVETQEKSPK